MCIWMSHFPLRSLFSTRERPKSDGLRGHASVLGEMRRERTPVATDAISYRICGAWGGWRLRVPLRERGTARSGRGGAPDRHPHSGANEDVEAVNRARAGCGACLPDLVEGIWHPRVRGAAARPAPATRRRRAVALRACHDPRATRSSAIHQRQNSTRSDATTTAATKPAPGNPTGGPILRAHGGQGPHCSLRSDWAGIPGRPQLPGSCRLVKEATSAGRCLDP